MAQILDGTKIAAEIRSGLKEEVADLKKKDPTFQPKLAVIQVGNPAASGLILKLKLKAAEEIGISLVSMSLPDTSTQEEVVGKIEELNKDPTITGIQIFLPLDSKKNIDTHSVNCSIATDKDVDGLHRVNFEKGNLDNCIPPCFPYGSLELIKHSRVEIEGKYAVVVGRSKIVCSPMPDLLEQNHAIVTVCDVQTADLKAEIQKADILVVALGEPEIVKGDWIKPGAVVVDCGNNSTPDSQTDSGRRMVGDVDFEEARKVAAWISPVPGGVGPMTIAMLMKHTVDSAKTPTVATMILVQKIG